MQQSTQGSTERKTSSMSRISNPLRIHKLQSTKHHRDTQRACGGLALAGSSFGNTTNSGFSIPAALTINLIQFLASMRIIIKPEITTIERTAHIIQASIALGEVLITAILFFEKQTCANNATMTLCSAFIFLEILYNALLMAGWGVAEAFKEPSAANEDSQASETNTPEMSRFISANAASQRLSMRRFPSDSSLTPQNPSEENLDKKTADQEAHRLPSLSKPKATGLTQLSIYRNDIKPSVDSLTDQNAITIDSHTPLNTAENAL